MCINMSANLLSADTNQLIDFIGQTVSIPDDFVAGILRCDWSNGLVDNRKRENGVNLETLCWTEED
mgnify:CR=1 FL=1